ncbi:hypothetical protein [Christensenella intestinihominis]|uniref:hypothetical protein n=1 Tax=Christensenella intestinihominis TaxID=1851429 RepID=UPI00082A8599|nr:hypothetical protein [Christensenella intestinihominis]
MDGIYQVYARPDESGNVLAVFSTAFEKPQGGDVLLDEGPGDEHAHVQGRYNLYDEYGRYNYKIVAGKITEIAENKKPPIPEPPKSEMEQIRETLDIVVLSMLGGDLNV